MKKNGLAVFKTADSVIKLEVPLEEDTVWLTQAQMTQLFGVDNTVITRHVNNVFKEGELEKKKNVQKLHVANSGKPVNYYNLDVIISVGYRVKSKRGVEFRKWANSVLKRHRLQEKISIIIGFEDKKIVLINDIRFKGKRKINWNEVEEYLKEYVGCCYEIAETAEKIYIGKDFPGEYAGSIDSARLKGTVAKAKANAVQGLPELIEIANNVRYQDNAKDKHKYDAKNGWYRYTAYFALPVFNQFGEADKYNIFRIEMLIRHDKNGRKYLYDLVNIKKETSTPPGPMSYGNKPVSS